ncbi:MAG: aldo/keto reductase, partial [Caldilineaceae bacterium]|nr:aldo/keto reductase [Caldilineaceae bacterium]
MEYRTLGRSGLQVSAIGLGTNQFGGKVDQAGVNEIIAGAIDLGINLIDTADVYQQGRSEEALGIALKGKWDKVVLATKGFFPTGDGPNDKGASRYHIFDAVDASLRRLQRDHIDLYQVHRWDANTPIEETLRALDDLVRSGKVRYVGASNYMAWQLARANLLAEVRNWTPFVSIQNHYHMFERDLEREMIPYCNAHNVGILPFFPLAGG